MFLFLGGKKEMTHQLYLRSTDINIVGHSFAVSGNISRELWLCDEIEISLCILWI